MQPPVHTNVRFILQFPLDAEQRGVCDESDIWRRYHRPDRGLGVAALAWWLITSGRFDGSFGPTASKAPAACSRRRHPKSPAPSAITKANEALEDLGDRLGAPAPTSNDGSPSFDVARIEANGEAVIAGRAMPGAAVELLANGQVHDRTSADSSGAFVFVPKPLPPGTYEH